RIPLHHHVRKIGKPDCAMNRLAALAISQYLVVPALVNGSAGLRQVALDPTGLDAIPVSKLPFEISDIHEVAEARMKRLDMIVLEINLDERFPVARVLLDVDTVEHE